jgi:hypothetical protein
MAKPKLSGAARRKIKREREREAAREAARTAKPNASAPGEFIRRTEIGRLETVADCAREIRQVFHDVRTGSLAAEIGTKAAYCGMMAVKATEIVELLEQQARAIAAWEARYPRDPFATRQALDLMKIDDAEAPNVGESLVAEVAA